MSFLDVGLLQPRDLVLHVLGVQLEVIRLGAEEVKVGGTLQDGLLVVAELRVQFVETVGGLKQDSLLLEKSDKSEVCGLNIMVNFLETKTHITCTTIEKDVPA